MTQMASHSNRPSECLARNYGSQRRLCIWLMSLACHVQDFSDGSFPSMLGKVQGSEIEDGLTGGVGLGPT